MVFGAAHDFWVCFKLRDHKSLGVETARWFIIGWRVKIIIALKLRVPHADTAMCELNSEATNFQNLEFHTMLPSNQAFDVWLESFWWKLQTLQAPKPRWDKPTKSNAPKSISALWGAMILVFLGPELWFSSPSRMRQSSDLALGCLPKRTN